MPFRNENIVAGISTTSPYQVGKSNIDDDSIVEQNIGIPTASDPSGSYVYYECYIKMYLDSGIVIHNRLPQVDNEADTLSSGYLDSDKLDKIIDQGVNLKSKDQYTDVVQRMAHSRYWFHLWGQALRVGYKIPIPGIKTIGGIPAIPYDKNPQWAYNSIVPGGNYGGLILWRAEWSLWYTTQSAPTSQLVPVVDLAAHIKGDAKAPATIQSPYSKSDDNAQTVTPPQPVIPIGGPQGGNRTRR